MDPITATTTLITLASFIKDLIEVGQSIKSSIEKVGENRRRIRDLTNDVLRTLADLASLTRGQEDAFQVPALLSALGNLKAEMLHVLSICREISPVQRPGFRGFGSQIKVWMKRDDLEKKIGRLKEHVNKCYIQFTAFSTARIETTTGRIVNSTLRVEQTLIINNVESQVKLRRLEGMMAHLLLETQFGQNVLNETMEIIASDMTHKSLEYQYISAQTRSLMDSFQNLLTGGNLVLHEPLWDPTKPLKPVFARSTPLNTLQQILGAVVKVNESPTVQISLKSMKDIVAGLGVHLDNIGMISEAIAWERLRIRILRSLGTGDHCARALREIAHALSMLSTKYWRQLQFQRALEASQQSLDLLHRISESLPEVDTRIELVSSLVTHAKNLRQTGEKMATLSIAQDAVALSRPMATQLIESGAGTSPLTRTDEYRAVCSCAALSVFAKALSSADRHLESYEASMEGFQTFLRLRLPSKHLYGRNIDSFLDQICKVAEEGTLSLGMLADCVILFRDLARTYPKEASFQFLQLFHAYVYFSQHNTLPDSGSAFETLRLFMEPTEDRPPPALDITIRVDFSSLGERIAEDVVRAYYTRPSETFDLLMQNIFVTHFEQAVAVLRQTVEGASPDSDTIIWAVYSIADIVPLVSKSERMDLLRIMTKPIQHLGTILAHWRAGPRWFYDFIFAPTFLHLWSAGLLDDALAESDEVIEYFRSCSNTDADVDGKLWELHLSQPFVFCDMGRISEAIKMIQETDMILQDWDPGFLRRWTIQTRILQRSGRNQEALQNLGRGVAIGTKQFWTDNGQSFNVHLNFLLVELAAAWVNAGQLEKGLKDAERAVILCRKAVDTDTEARNCTLVHALTTFAHCLATDRRNDEALVVAQEAVSIYTQNAGHMWEGEAFLDTIRKEELGGNVFHSLSLRLTTFGRQEESLVNANKATELYRELVALAPGHLPALASSLRNLASILSNIGRRDEALDALDEAVRIMQNLVDPEPYFLPTLAEALDQLASYLEQKGDDGAAAAAAEGAEEARGRFTDLPPQPEYLFEKVEMEWEDDDEEADEGWETASEGDYSEYEDALDTGTDVEVVVSETDLVIPESPPTSISLAPALEQALTDAAIPAKTSLPAILCTPLEVRVNMSVRSTPMDILWWLLTGILFAVVWSRLV